MITKQTAQNLLSLAPEKQDFPFGAGLAGLRQQVIFELTGEKPAKAKCGAGNVQKALYSYFNATGNGNDCQKTTVTGLKRIANQ